MFPTEFIHSFSESKMGNAHGHVINDTEYRHRILSFNYGDEIRHEPVHVYDIEPYQTCTVSAEMCPIRGLVVSTGVAKSGKHAILKYDGTIKISTLLREGNDNPAYEDAKQAIAVASCANLTREEKMERYTRVENELKEEAKKAQKKYNRKPIRRFRQDVVEAVPSQSQESIMRSAKGSRVEQTNKSPVQKEQKVAAAPVTPDGNRGGSRRNSDSSKKSD